MKVHAAPVGSPWMRTLAFGHHEDRTSTHGYAAPREAAMAAFAKSWRSAKTNRFNTIQELRVRAAPASVVRTCAPPRLRSRAQ
jgi:hypothetical protein